VRGSILLTGRLWHRGLHAISGSRGIFRVAVLSVFLVLHGGPHIFGMKGTDEDPPPRLFVRKFSDEKRASSHAIPMRGGMPHPRSQDRPANEDPEAFWRLKEKEGFSFASGARAELGPLRTQTHVSAVRTLRIGLNPTRFSDSGEVLAEFDTSTEQEHRRITLTATGPFELLLLPTGTVHDSDVRADAFGDHTIESQARSQDMTSCQGAGLLIASGQAGEEFTFLPDPRGIFIAGPSGVFGPIPNPICVAPAPDAFVVVTSLRRRNLNRAGNPFEPPAYRGVLEIHPVARSGRLRLINVLDLEEYLQGVITNEMPASFHPEALKAQAVAARTFALANLGRFAARGFDLDDSTLSQVYRGRISEHPNGRAAVQSTRGLVVARDGELVPTFYSSSMGGHTESNEWIFNTPSDQLPGSNAHPALRAIHDADFPVPVDLTTDEGALAFYSQVWDHFDSPQRSGNPRYRWVANRSVTEIAERVARVYGLSLGSIRALVPLLRSPSGRIVRLQIVGERATVTLQGWRTLRDFFQLFNSPSAIVPRWDAGSQVTSFDFYGGGWGHNVGMSQYGAHGRGRSGQTFREILAAYYTGAEVISIETPPPTTNRKGMMGMGGKE
jgi:SpoIID/LytB domain protein